MVTTVTDTNMGTKVPQTIVDIKVTTTTKVTILTMTTKINMVTKTNMVTLG